MTVLFAIIITLFILFMLTENGIYRMAFYNSDEAKNARYKLPASSQYNVIRDQMTALVEAAVEVPCTDVSVKSFDGLKLCARWYEIRRGAPVILMFHGWKGGSLRDMAGAHRIARENGYNILLVDERAHGRSAGHNITFGVKERYDVLTWSEWIIDHCGKNTEIILSGVSMGGAVVLMASDLKLPEQVKGIIADSAFASPRSIICKVAEDKGVSGKTAWPFVYMAARMFAHFDPNASSSLESVKHTDIPVLLLHGTEDRFLPCEMSRQICSNCRSDCELEIFDGAMHGVSYCIDTERYTDVVLRFVRRCTGGQAGAC